MDLSLYNYLPFLPIAILGLAFLIQLYFLIFVYRKLAVYRVSEPGNSSNETPSLSVVICARNEEENLKNNLELILTQVYPEYDVIVVNDCSYDDSEWVLKEFSDRYPHLSVVTLKEDARFKHGKKFAVTIGIKAAKYNHIVFTDADCRPESSNWLQYMGSALVDEKEIVLGYSPYIKYPGFLNRLIRFETFHTAMSYLSHALKRNPYMGVGRNMGYTKALFFEGKGFASHMHILSGDDDLFVNQNANRKNTTISIHTDAHVWSEPKRTYSSYALQKTRHHGASKAYKGKHKWMLSLQVGSAITFYVFLVFSLVLFPMWWPYWVGGYLFRLIIQLLVYSPCMKKLQVGDLLPFLPIMDIFFYFYTSFKGFSSLLKKEIRWK